MSEKPINSICMYCHTSVTHDVDVSKAHIYSCPNCRKPVLKTERGTIYIVAEQIGGGLKWVLLKITTVNYFKILMSRDNPGGWKLEELLQDIVEDLLLKNKALGGGDPSIDKCKITANNTVIIALLETAIFVQDRTMKLLNDIYGSDRGPGDPRV